MSILVSYCIPAYNVESYLEDCIDSICQEGLENIEIIIVDDCSTDRTGQVAENLAAKDSRIKTIRHQFNMGLPCSRNSALNIATGEYLRHVDADDLITPGSTTHLVEVIGDSDIARGSSKTFKESPGVNSDMPWANKEIKPEQLPAIVDSRFFRINALGYVWLYLYRKRFLDSIGDPRFEPNTSILEDDLYNSNVLLKAKSVAVTDMPVTLYRDGGMSSQKHWTFRQYMEQASALLTIRKRLAGEPYFQSVYLNRKAIFVIDKLYNFCAAGLNFEQFCAYAELIRLLYKDEDLSNYEGDGTQENGDYLSYWAPNLTILSSVAQGRLEDAFSRIKEK